MSHLFPEQPLLIYPSLAKAYGVEEALLLGIYHQFSQHHGYVDEGNHWHFIVRRSEWLKMTEFWDDEKLALVTSNLVQAGVISAQYMDNGSIRIGSKSSSNSQPVECSPDQSVAHSDPQLSPPDSQASSTVAASPMTATPATHSGNADLSNKGPAPSFGGSTGWARREDDELETLFKEQEIRNQQLAVITPDWRPSNTTWQMLAKSSIPEAFIEDQRDEFIAYWLAQGQKKKSWDPQFIDHVKRKWVREQNRQGREARIASELETEVNGERHQSASRAEKREQISKSLMDIKNIDW